MVDLTYVKKRKRKQVAKIVTGVSAVLIVPFLILSFIGKEIGHFTIGLKNSNVSLALATDKELTNKTTFIGLDKLAPYAVYTVDGINKNYTDDTIDNIDSNDSIGKRVDPSTEETTALYFFKYTFYVVNVGEVNATYDISFSITDNKRPTNVNYSLDDILRVRWYENSGDSSSHSYKTYAKKSLTPNFKEGETEPFYNTCIGKNTNGVCKDGYAELFSDDITILKNTTKHFKVGDYTRYTVLMWLEGNDPEAVGTTPDETYLKLAINVEAYEDVDEE